MMPTQALDDTRPAALSLDTLITRNLLPETPGQTTSDGCALVLMGGGARTAYQAGVLKALAVMHTHWRSETATLPSSFPFRWLFGTSAGALNAAFLASQAQHDLQAFHLLADFWRHLRSGDVYRLEAPSWVRANRIVAGLTLARQVRRHRALLDTLPLVDTLHRAIDLRKLEHALNDGVIDTLGVTASSYTTGEHWTFCQVRAGHPMRPWRRPGRRADFQPITIEHLMASSAIPFLFPAVALWVDGHREHFGDGSMRQLSPLSPAIQFGARRILAIGVGQPQRSGLVTSHADEPSAGTIAGHAMASVFHDTLQADVEQTLRVSQTLDRLPPSLSAALPYRPVSVMAMQPSLSLDELTRKHLDSLPGPTRNTLIGLGALDTQNESSGSAASLASYLLFEPAFVQALLDLGEQDAWHRQAELRAFFTAIPPPSGQTAVP